MSANVKQAKDESVVYSTGIGRRCPVCNQAEAECNCKAKKAAQLVGDGNIRIRRETKGRKGKGVVVISGLPVNEQQLKQLGKELKQRFGCGGSVKDGTIEIQGDLELQIREELRKRGYTVR